MLFFWVLVDDLCPCVSDAPLIELIGNNVLLTQEVTIPARGNETNDEELGDNEQTTSHRFHSQSDFIAETENWMI